jgi:pyrroloquinoline quinone biosynthesis protein D
MSEPTLLDTDQPRVAPGFRLQWEPAQDCHVLLYPEGMVKLNRPSGEILTRCDGKTPLADVVTSLEAAFSAQGLRGDVAGFLTMARQQQWVTW